MSFMFLNNKKYEEIQNHYNVNLEPTLFTIIQIGIITNQHVILTTDMIADVSKYIQVLSSKVFGISNPAICSCHENTEWNDIGDALNDSNVFVLTNFDSTCREIQAYLLEGLMKSLFIFANEDQSTDRVVHLPEDFHVFIVNRQHSKKSNDMLYYLKDYFFFQHSFIPQDEIDLSSRIHDLESLPPKSVTTLVTKKELDNCREKLAQIKIIPDLKVYMQNIVVFLRTHRVVRKGISPGAVKKFDLLLRILCVLDSSSFATPTLISLAARTLFPLKIELVAVQDEPTLHYGSDINLLEKWLPKWDAEMVVEDVLNTVPSPL